MRSKNILLGILAIMLVFTMTAVGCDNGSTDSKGNSPKKAIFQGIAAGYKYVLTITENKSRAAYITVTGDSYELRITKAGEADKISKGTVSAVGAGGTLTLQPETANSPTFSVSINGADIAAITGSITLADGTTVTAGDFEEGGEEPNPPTTQTFTTIAAMATWLTAQPANTAATPYAVKLNVDDLGGDAGTSGSAGFVLKANSTKYVSLDLSGNTFTSIEKEAFSYNDAGCTSLASITIPSTVTTIGVCAFAWCTSLTSITIPESVTTIGESIFYDCTKLTSVTFQGTITSTNLINNAFTTNGDLRAKFYATDATNGTPGTYTTTAPVSSTSVWIKQN